MSINVTFIFKDGRQQVATGEAGQTLLQVAHAHNIYQIEGACGGAMACSTCHIIIDPFWYGKLTPATMDETDMLDLATNLTKTSRLGCQINLIPALNGLIVKLPD